MPVFLPGFGAYVRWRALGVSLETRAAISLAGPLAGFLASVVCALLWWQTGDLLWAALARAGAFLNLLNLIPVWVLDGGQAVLALSKNERIILLTASLAFWLILGESVFFLVALGATYQIFFRRGPPSTPQPRYHCLFRLCPRCLGHNPPPPPRPRIRYEPVTRRGKTKCEAGNLRPSFLQLNFPQARIVQIDNEVATSTAKV